MADFFYKNVTPIDRFEAIKAIKSGISEKVYDGMLSIAFFEQDVEWAQNIFIELFNGTDSKISALAAVCLGHLARIRGKINKDLVVSMLRSRLNEVELAGEIGDALEDIDQFVK